MLFRVHHLFLQVSRWVHRRTRWSWELRTTTYHNCTPTSEYKITQFTCLVTKSLNLHVVLVDFPSKFASNDPDWNSKSRDQSKSTQVLKPKECLRVPSDYVYQVSGGNLSLPPPVHSTLYGQEIWLGRRITLFTWYRSCTEVNL